MKKVTLILVAVVGFALNSFAQFSEKITVCNDNGEKIVFYTDGTVRVSVDGLVVARGTYTNGGSRIELSLIYTDGSEIEWEGSYIVDRSTQKPSSMYIHRSTYKPCR